MSTMLGLPVVTGFRLSAAYNATGCVTNMAAKSRMECGAFIVNDSSGAGQSVSG